MTLLTPEVPDRPAQPLGSRQFLEALVAGRHPGTVHLLRTFAWGHLPEKLALVSRPCAELAVEMTQRLPDGPELTAGLRLLRQAKDCFVIAQLEGQS